MVLFVVLALAAATASAALANETFTGHVATYGGGGPQAGATVYLEQSTSSTGPWTTVQTCTTNSNGDYNCGSHADFYYYRQYGVYIPNCFEYWEIAGPAYVTTPLDARVNFSLNNVTRICSSPS